MIYESSEQLLEELVRRFEGQKICVTGARKVHGQFLHSLNKKVRLVPENELERGSVVFVLSFGREVVTQKPCMTVADNFLQFALIEDSSAVLNFFHIGQDEEQLLYAMASEFAWQNFNEFCAGFFVGGSKKCSASYMREVDALIEATNGRDLGAIADALAVLRTGQKPKFCGGTAAQQVAVNLLAICLCYVFLSRQVFTPIFACQETLSQQYGVQPDLTLVSGAYVCRTLKKFDGKILPLGNTARRLITACTKNLKKLDENIFDKITRHSTIHCMLSRKDEFSLIKVMQLLGLI